MNKRTVGDIARETNVLWEEEPCSTCIKEEVEQAQHQLYGTSYFFVRKTLIGHTQTTWIRMTGEPCNGKLLRTVCAVRRFEIFLSQTGGTREKFLSYRLT